MPLGLTVTLRREKMYAFLEKFIKLVLPRIRDFRGLDSTNFDKDGNYLLVLIPREKTAACNSVKLIIDKNNFYILQVSFDDFMGNSTILKFSNISMNTGLTQKIFQFKPPAGVEVFEMP